MFDVVYLFLVIKRMLHSYLNLTGKHASIISFLHFVLKKTTKNTSAGLLGQTRGRKRKNSRVGGDFHARSCTKWSGGQVHDDH